MPLIKIRTVLVLLICFPLFVGAQQNTISPYSAFGIGELQNQGFAFNNSMGGVGTAFRPTSALNPINPASLSALSETAFEAGISGSALFLSDGILNQEYFSSTLSYLSLGFPISEGFAISGGLLPFSFQGYELEQSFEYNDPADSVAYSISHGGNGGFNRAYINVGVELVKGLSVGATASMLFGTLNQQRDILFEDEYMLNRRDDYSYYVRDYSYDLGLQYHMEFGEKYFTFGATYSPEFDMNASNRGAIYTYDIVSDFEYIRDTVEVFGNATDGLVLPMGYAAGLAFGKKDQWFISADYDFKEWSQLSLFGTLDPNISNAATYRLGMWWIPNVQDIHNYWNIVQYRAGFNYQAGFLTVAPYDIPTQVSDMNVSFGLGLPIKRSKTIANIGVQLGKRGTLNNGLIEEKYIKFNLAFTFNDKWFTKRKID